MILNEHPDSPLEARGMRAIGYWCNNHHADLPDPRNYIDLGWDQTERDAVIQHLKNGKPTAFWRGWSNCRICGKNNGSYCLSDGTYIWPGGFAHYLEDHGVKPPDEFIQHILPKPRREDAMTIAFALNYGEDLARIARKLV
jgi:hypothetical protein